MRILISAYGCDPARGSEPGVGWNWARCLAREHDVWVILPESERAAFAPETAVREGVRLVFCDLPSCIRFNNQNTLVRYHIHYHCWQVLAYFVAKRLHAQVQFDLVHHLVLGTHWKPSFLSLLPIPFVWGPLGGGETGPAPFVRCFPLKERLNERLRNLVRQLGEGDPFVRLTARRSALALAKTSQTATRLRALGAANVEVMSEAGLSQQELSRLDQIPQRTESPFRVISMGRMLHWKGFEFSLQAFAALLERFPQSEYWLAGDGPYRPRLSALAQKLGIQERVVFLGAVTREEAITKLSDCDVLIHPSIHDSGGWTCLEAMAAGKPVVCLDLGGPAAQVTRETGFLVRADDPDRAVSEMGEILALLAASPDVRLRKGMAGRVHVQTHFAWERKSQEIQERYNRFAIGRTLATAG
jgi:glycosyltransferase involved in cell wall biosynthesis